MQYTIGEETKIEYDVVCGQKVTVDTEVAVPVVSVEKPEPLIPERYTQVKYITVNKCTDSFGSYINLNSVSNYDIWGYTVSYSVDPDLWSYDAVSYANIIGFSWGSSWYERLAITKRNSYPEQIIVKSIQGTAENSGAGAPITKSSMRAFFNINQCHTVTHCFQHQRSNSGSPYTDFAYSSFGEPFRWDIYGSTLTNYTGSANNQPLTAMLQKSYGRDESFYAFSYSQNGKARTYSYAPMIRIFEIRFYKNVGGESDLSAPKYTANDVIAWWYPVYDNVDGVYGLYDVINRCFRTAGPCGSYGADNITGPEIINE